MEVVGDYEYSKKDLIGHGAFAVVFKGRTRKNHDKVVAIKSITKKNIAKSQNLLSKEIKILQELSDLHHDNVVQLMECKETTNHVYLVMEYCNGGDLADYLQAKGTLSEDTISQFLRQIADAMRALNAKGILHRDMKPQNILLCYPPGQKNPPASQIVLKIADFGFARFLQDGVMAATLCGSPMYMAPEVIMSLQYDAKADLWSIGTIVFQSLTGKAPFQAQTPQQLKQFYEKNVDLKPNIPAGTSPEMKDLLLKLLKRNAKDRIDFEDFFVHPFLRPTSPAASSSPVPVPGRSPSFSSESPASLKTASASPLSGKMEYSPPVQSVKPRSPHRSKVDDIVDQHRGSPSEAGGFLKVAKDNGNSSRCSTPTEDFVMVPDEMNSDNSDVVDGKEIKMSVEEGNVPESLSTVTVTPNSGAALFKRESSNSQLNPSRPITLQVAAAENSPPSSAPIPVPSQVAAYRRMQSNSPTSPITVNKNLNVAGSADRKEIEKRESSLSRNGSESKLTAPDIGSLSPPVQFSIGTPPSSSGSAWRRGSMSNSPGRYGTTPPSPLKKSGSVPAHLSPVQYSGTGYLPPILDSPTKIPSTINYPNLNETNPGAVSNAMYQRHHPYTVPENIQRLEFNGNLPPSITQETRNLSNADLQSGRQSGGTSMLSQQLFKAAFEDNSPHQDAGRTVIPFAGGRKRLNSDNSEKMGSLERGGSTGFFRPGASLETSPPPSLMYAQSPPNMEGPITFVAPELAEETLMDENHNAIMAKLNFVLDLVECIIELARVRAAPLNTFSESLSCNKGEGIPEQIPKVTEAQRRLEQLILHVRSLHLLSSALQLARDELKSGRLTITNSLKTVVRQMNQHYHMCVASSRQLQQRLGSSVQTALSPQIVIATADKLIYNYAIEMCQTAALDELFNNPQECFRRYQTAQILLHSLAQQSRNSKDKESLNKYKEAVERRLSNLQGQAYQYLSS